MERDLQLNADITGLEGLALAIRETEKKTQQAGKNATIRAAFAYTRSAAKATKLSKKIRNQKTGSGGGKFYMVFRRGKRPFKAYIPKSTRGKSDSAAKRRMRRNAVIGRYRTIRGRGYGKISWVRMFGKIAMAGHGSTVKGGARPRPPVGADVGGYKNPAQFVSAQVRGMNSTQPRIKLINELGWISDAYPELEEGAARKAAKSLLGGARSELQAEFKRLGW